MSIIQRTRNHHNILPTLTLILLLVFTLTGCGFSETAAPAEEARPDLEAAAVEKAPAEEPAQVEIGEAAPAEEEAMAEPARSGESGGGAVVPAATAPAKDLYLAEEAEGEMMADESASMDLAYGDDAAEESLELEADSADSRAETVERQQQVERLKAGEVDDNAQWDEYLLYRRDYAGPRVNDRDISERYIIEVEDGQGNPVLGANVTIYLDGQQRREIAQGRTYANGQMLFHPLALDEPLEQVDRFRVEVEKDGVVEDFVLSRFEAQSNSTMTGQWTITLDWQRDYENLNLDVLFLIDATGSMADEIDKIQSTIFDVAAQIDALPGQPAVRYGMVTYRDRGDLFVTNTYDFTPDVTEFHADLKTVSANGGDDYPESLNEGLHNAIHDVEWRGGDTVQLIFLVADAPPHLDYAQDYDYAEEMAIAAERGIKIFPIASSGLDDQGEYIFRQLAQYTQGRFIFLTYDGPTNGGSPGETTTHHVEDYSVENLDSLLVKLVQEELAHQNPQVARIQ